jgi:hypothetical protein
MLRIVDAQSQPSQTCSRMCDVWCKMATVIVPGPTENLEIYLLGGRFRHHFCHVFASFPFTRQSGVKRKTKQFQVSKSNIVDYNV